jgi:DnaJ-class molecular chaperone
MGEIETCRKCNGAQRFVRVRPIPTTERVECAMCGRLTEREREPHLSPLMLSCGHPNNSRNTIALYERFIEECDECHGMGKRVYETAAL